MKAYILTEVDFDNLLAAIDRDPIWGERGGSAHYDVRGSEQSKAYSEAHSFYNYQLRTWINGVKK